MRLLHVSTYDNLGGAARVAWNLFRGCRRRGHHAWLAAGEKRSDDPNVFVIPNEMMRTSWARAWRSAARAVQGSNGRNAAAFWFGRSLGWCAEPRRSLERFLGVEDFSCPGTGCLLGLPPERPDIVHCHNLHGWYFDLRLLPRLAREVPTVLALHDAWLLSGHCAHSLECDRWKTGCGHCPDLASYPGVRRDATAYNWRRKRDIYRRSRLYVTTACRWLMERVEQSILTSAEARVIPNGVDLETFRPGEKAKARAALGLPVDAPILLFVAHDMRTNVWKDYATLEAALARLGRNPRMAGLVCLCRGAAPAEKREGHATIRFLPFEEDEQTVAQFYQAADVYVHAAKVDTFPTTVIEALACGTPVVATAVGGIPEQVDDGITGFLTAPGEPESLAARLELLLTDETLLRKFSGHAREAARCRFDLEDQVDANLGWYQEILAREKRVDRIESAHRPAEALRA